MTTKNGRGRGKYICHAIAHLFYNGIRILAPKGSNGTFRLFLEGGDAEMFEVSPVEVINEASFSIRVRDPDQLDYERIRDVDTDFLANGLDYDLDWCYAVKMDIGT